MNNSGAISKEAKLLNPEQGYAEARGRQLDAAARRRALMALLPPGRVLDQAMLDDCARGPQSWAPFNVVRQLLAEAGASSIGSRLILSPAEVEALEDQMRRNPQGSSIDASREMAARARGASAR